jgi:hypothetical protein
VSRALAEEARRAASKNFMIIVSVLEEFSGFLNWVLLWPSINHNHRPILLVQLSNRS